MFQVFKYTMAEMKGLKMHDGEIGINLSINRGEYKILKHHMTDIILLPCGKDSLTNHLTTGKLGNSNRIMLPKKILREFGIENMEKKVPSNIFILDGNAFLLIRLKKSELGIPKFEEEQYESHDRS